VRDRFFHRSIHADIWLYDLLLTVICLIWRGQLRCDRPRWQRLAAAWHHFIRRDGVALRMLRSEAG
jgi:cytochrome b561